jgi:hypothetical protein
MKTRQLSISRFKEEVMNTTVHNRKEQHSRDKKCLLAAFVSASIFVFAEDEPDQPDAAAPANNPCGNPTPGAEDAPKHTPEDAVWIVAEDEGCPEDEYDANEDPLIANSMF